MACSFLIFFQKQHTDWLILFSVICFLLRIVPAFVKLDKSDSSSYEQAPRGYGNPGKPGVLRSSSSAHRTRSVVKFNQCTVTSVSRFLLFFFLLLHQVLIWRTLATSSLKHKSTWRRTNVWPFTIHYFLHFPSPSLYLLDLSTTRSPCPWSSHTLDVVSDKMGWSGGYFFRQKTDLFTSHRCLCTQDCI